MILKILRPASAMIELIFAIVIMGIALLSAPIMLETAGKSNNVAFEQESIAIVVAQVSSMLTYAWDEKNTQIYAPNNILITTGDSRLDGNNTHPDPSKRIRNPDAETGTNTSNFGMNKENETTEGTPDDIDDFDDTHSNLTIAKSGNQLSQYGDIMDTSVTMLTNVTYLNDVANYDNPSGRFSFSKVDEAAWETVGTSTNIKLVTTTLVSENIKGKKIKLRAFMCNIGAAQPSTRSGI